MKLTKAAKELDEYEKHVLYPLSTERIEIDLDDGVKVNYRKFGSALCKIAALERKGEQVIPVDTHVRRIAIRLGFAGENDEFVAIEKKLEKAFPYEEHAFVHHSFINFGRTKCSAQRPSCEDCPLKLYCKYNLSTKGKKSKRG